MALSALILLGIVWASKMVYICLIIKFGKFSAVIFVNIILILFLRFPFFSINESCYMCIGAFVVLIFMKFCSDFSSFFSCQSGRIISIKVAPKLMSLLGAEPLWWIFHFNCVFQLLDSYFVWLYHCYNIIYAIYFLNY